MSPLPVNTILIGIASFAGSLAASFLMLAVLTRAGVLDVPNARSSHRRPVVRGGGAGFMLVILAGLGTFWMFQPPSAPPVVLVGAALLVALISFTDDIRRIPLLARLAAQAAAVALVLATIDTDGGIVSDDLPIWLDRAIVGIGWLWFINLFNFMDGIDGIAAGEAAVIGAGILALALAAPALHLPAIEATIVAAGVLGFLLLNWHPTRIFMGDVGSVGLGFLVGWLLIETADAGAGVAALILPMMFILDATVTLLWRMSRGHSPGQPHRDHAYQVGTDRGLGQARVATIFVGIGVVLVGLAVVSLQQPIVALLVAVAGSAAVLAWLRYGGGAIRRTAGTRSR